MKGQGRKNPHTNFYTKKYDSNRARQYAREDSKIDAKESVGLMNFLKMFDKRTISNPLKGVKK